MKNHQAPGYKAVPLSFNRMAVRASASVTRERNAIHSVTEVDITEPRRLIREHQDKTGEKLSFTAYLVTCLAQVIRANPQFNSFINGRKLVMLDEVTISVLIERELDGERVPEPIAIRDAPNKTHQQISREIREAQSRTGDKLGSLAGVTWFRLIPGFLLKLFIRLADRNIRMAKRYGKVAVTAVGMYSKEPVWFIPHGTATVLLTVGSISRKVIELDNQFVSREHLCLTVSFDHDIIDGAPAARFMSQLIDTIKGGEAIHAD
ncbi:MAG TPA: dehydrogenase [Bacteroidales bacterium]|nr:dehydrogenase [Bacteroidales bacterium]